MSEGARRKTLYLVRHAKAALAETPDGDHQRPLKGRGPKDAADLGRWMQENMHVPQLVLSSDSTRTWQTWQAMVPAFQTPIDTRFTRYLYLASREALLALFARLPESVERVMILGHNNGLEDLASFLTGTETTMKTGSLVALSVEGDWASLGEGAPVTVLAEGRFAVAEG